MSNENSNENTNDKNIIMDNETEIPKQFIIPNKIHDDFLDAFLEEDDEIEEENYEKPPLLKYERIGSFNIQKEENDQELSQTISCLKLTNNSYIIGTHQGKIYNLPFDKIVEFKSQFSYESTLIDICLDSTCRYIGACFRDGTVIVFDSLNDQATKFDFDDQITCLAIHPNFKPKGGSCVCGTKTGKIIYREKKFFSRSKILYSGNGEIISLTWKSNYIVWSNQEGIFVFDIETENPLGKVPPLSGSFPSLNNYRCNFKWISSDSFIVGWANVIIQIQITKQRTVKWKSLPPFNFIICGIGFHDNDYLVFTMEHLKSRLTDEKIGKILKTIQNFHEKKEKKQEEIEEEIKKEEIFEYLQNQFNLIPDVRIITQKGEEILKETISIKGYEVCSHIDFRMETQCMDWEIDRGCQTQSKLYVFTSPFQFVRATEADADDKVTWLVERLRYQDAFDVALENSGRLKRNNPTKLGENLLRHLLASKNKFKIQSAALQCPKVCGENPLMWEKWISQFFENQQFQEISPYIPIQNPRLKQEIYEMILNSFLENDNLDLFYQTINKWPKNIYNPRAIILIILDKQKKINSLDERLALPLADLYIEIKEYDKALKIHFYLKKLDVFEMIELYNIFDSVSHKISELIKLDATKTIQLLVLNTDKIAPSIVVPQLSNNKQLLYQYLLDLSDRNPKSIQDYHVNLMKLIFEFDPKNLLNFFKGSNYVPLEIAYEFCQKNSLYNESVYILKRMGQNLDALILMLDKLKNINKAIKFVMKENDNELMTRLINYCRSSNPNFFTPLLKSVVHSQFQITKLLQRIPQGVEIPKLGEALKFLLLEYQSKVKLKNLATEVIIRDCAGLMFSLNSRMRMGMVIQKDRICPICSGKIVQSDDVVLFFCGHTFHKSCLREKTSNQPFCTECAVKQKSDND